MPIPKELAIHRTWTLEARPESLIPEDELQSLLQLDHRDGKSLDAEEIEARSFNILLPLAKKMVCDYRDQIGGLESSSSIQILGEPNIACALCPEKKRFRGWEALIIHLKNYWKCRSHQHRAFLRALKEALRSELESLRSEVAGIKSWPPVLIVNNSEGATFDGKLRRFKGLQGEELPHNLAELKIHEVLAVYRKGGADHHARDSRIVVAYPASEVGFVDAKQLNQNSSTPIHQQDHLEASTDQSKQLDSFSDEQEDEADALKRSFCGLLKREADNLRFHSHNREEVEEKHCSFEKLKFLPAMSEPEQCEYLREKWSRSFETTKQAFRLPKAFKKSSSICSSADARDGGQVPKGFEGSGSLECGWKTKDEAAAGRNRKAAA